MVSFTIPGQLSGKGRPRFARIGNFVQTYTPKKTRVEEERIKAVARLAMRSIPTLDGPLALHITVYRETPKSWSKKKRAEAIYPVSRPDLDNIIKEISDSCNDLIWFDDTQIVDIVASQRYTLDEARIDVTVTRIE